MLRLLVTVEVKVVNLGVARRRTTLQMFQDQDQIMCGYSMADIGVCVVARTITRRDLTVDLRGRCPLLPRTPIVVPQARYLKII